MPFARPSFTAMLQAAWVCWALPQELVEVRSGLVTVAV